MLCLTAFLRFGTLAFAEPVGCWRVRWDGEVGVSWARHSSAGLDRVRVRYPGLRSYMFLLRWQYRCTDETLSFKVGNGCNIRQRWNRRGWASVDNGTWNACESGSSKLSKPLSLWLRGRLAEIAD